MEFDNYENMFSRKERVERGIFYTPKKVLDKLLKNIKFNNNDIILDPSCGTGNIILECIERGAKPQNCFGVDIDKNALKILNNKVKEKYGIDISKNLFCQDFLDIKFDIKFDYVVSNPPYGIKHNKNNFVYKQKNIDSFELFVIKSLEISKKNSTLFFVLPESFTNVKKFTQFRKFLLKYNIKNLIDFGFSFPIIGKTYGLILENNLIENNLIDCLWEDNNYKIEKLFFIKNFNNNFSFWVSKEEYNIIEYLTNKKHIKLDNKNNIFGLGIITGNNNKFIKDIGNNNFLENNVPLIVPKNLKNISIIDENFIPTKCIEFDKNKLQQIRDIELYKSKKILYKFISNELRFYLDKVGYPTLNSINFIIPNKKYNLEQIFLLLNSRLTNWIYKKLFNSFKILNNNISKLPIFIEYFEHYDKFTNEDYEKYLGIFYDKNKNTYLLIN